MSLSEIYPTMATNHHENPDDPLDLLYDYLCLWESEAKNGGVNELSSSRDTKETTPQTSVSSTGLECYDSREGTESSGLQTEHIPKRKSVQDLTREADQFLEDVANQLDKKLELSRDPQTADGKATQPPQKKKNRHRTRAQVTASKRRKRLREQQELKERGIHVLPGGVSQ